MQIVCRVCEIPKDESEFHRDSSRPEGRRTICRACRSEARPSGPKPLVRAETPEEALRRKANLLALRELARRYEDEFKVLVGRFRDELGMEKRWQRAG